ncbi:MAG: hypothetical protein IJK44_05905 [Bacteroidales bacterium]|nr:hypothetical protein [Bacteroidales bacterium]
MATIQEELFQRSKPFFHYCSLPFEDALLYDDDKQMGAVLNFIAVALMHVPGCRLLAFAVMSNHIHLVVEGERPYCDVFIGKLTELLDNYYRYNGKARLSGHIEFEAIHIDSLRMLRAEIIYTIRNPFVVRTDVNVFACPSTSGYLYFNPMLKREGIPASNLRGRALRDFLHTRNVIALTDRFYVKDGAAQPWSFVDYERAMSFFPSARDFVLGTIRNVEGQVEIANRHGEPVSLADQEVLSLAYRLCGERYGNVKLSNLGTTERMQLGLKLKNEYRVSNGQIARTLGLSLKDVNAMFPLSAKI